MAEEKNITTEEKVEKAPAKKAAAAPKAAAKKPAAKAADKKPVAKKAAAGKTDAAKATGKKTAKAATGAPAAGTVKITLKRAMCNCSQKQIAVAHSLGLKRIGDVVIQPDNAATAGKIKKIAFLLDVVKP